LLGAKRRRKLKELCCDLTYTHLGLIRLGRVVLEKIILQRKFIDST